jgi:hypothetical protein
MTPSRRAFVRGLGASGALLPLLHPRHAHAAPPPRRLIVVITPNGVLDDYWWPAGPAGDAFTFPDMTKSLEPHKSELIVFKGLQLRCFMDDKPRAFGTAAPSAGGSHDNYPALLTGKKLLRFAAFNKTADGPSIDQYIADGLVKNGVKTPFRALTLGAKTQTGKSDQAIFRDADQPITPENSPAKLFDTLFAGRALDPGAFNKLRADRKSVLDFVAKDLQSFATRLGTEDKQKVQGHLQTIRDLEGELAAAGGAGTAGCAAPDKASLAMADFPTTIKAHMDLSVAALACDLTRVITLQLSDNGGTMVFDFLGGDFTQPSKSGDFGKIHNTHEIAHHAGEADIKPLKIQVEQFFMERVAYLIGKLKSVREGAGTLLDNTAVLYMNNAHNGGGHSSDHIPMVLAGRCGGAFKTGRYLQYNKLPHNGVLVALANAMGVPTETFGDPAYGGELPDLRAG